MLEPPQLNPLDAEEQQLSSKLHTLSLRVRRAIQRKKLILVICIHDLIRLVITLITIGEGENVDLLVNQEIHFLA